MKSHLFGTWVAFFVWEELEMAKSCKGLAEELVKCLSESMCVKVKICNICMNTHMDTLILLNLISLSLVYSQPVLVTTWVRSFLAMCVGRETVNSGLRW